MNISTNFGANPSSERFDYHQSLLSWEHGYLQQIS